MQTSLPRSSRHILIPRQLAGGMAIIVIIILLVIFTAPTWAYYSSPSQADMLLSFGTWPTLTPTPIPPACGSFKLTLTARGYWEIINSHPRFGVRGEICITNTGTAPLENPLLDHLVYASQAGEIPAHFSTLLVDLSAHPVILPGETYCYSYDHPFTPSVGMLFMATANFRFGNACPLIPVTARRGPMVLSALSDQPADQIEMVPFSLPDVPEIFEDSTPTPTVEGAALNGKIEISQKTGPPAAIDARVCFTNTSDETAKNFRSVSWLTARAGSGEYLPVDGTRQEQPDLAELSPGEEVCFKRTLELDMKPGVEYRFIARAEIDNLTGWLPGGDACPGEKPCPQGLTLEYNLDPMVEPTPSPSPSISPTQTVSPLPTQIIETIIPTSTPLPSSTPIPTEQPPTAVPTPTELFPPTATPTEETVAQIPTPKPSQELPTPVATPAME